MDANPDSFPACAAGPDRTLGDTAGSVRIGQFAIHFESEQLRLEMPFSNIEINTDPMDADRLLFSHPNHPGWEIGTYAKEILLHRNLTSRADLRKKLEEVQAEMIGPPPHTLKVYGVLGAILFLLVALWLGNNAILGMIVGAIPQSFETSLGDDVLREVKQQWEMSSDPLATNYVFMVGQRLISKAPQTGIKYKFHVSSEDEVNAIALPGGHVVVFQGLIDMTETPEELAGVMAHEIAHVVKRHTLRKAAEAAGPMLAIKYLFGQKSSVLTALAATSAYIGQQKYSRLYEHEADDLAVDFLVKAEINPQGLVDFFSRLRKTEGPRIKAFAVFDSHPATEDRIDRLQAKIDSLPTKKYKPFARLKKPPVREGRLFNLF